MKYALILILAAMITVLGCTPTDKPAPAEEAAADSATIDPWLTDFSLAKLTAEEAERPILINFTGSDWCGWCIKLSNEVFSQPAFLDYAKDNLVLLKLDFPRKKQLPEAERKANELLATEYGIQGFPTIVLVDNTGREIARTGYQAGGAEAYVKHLGELLSK